MYTKKILFPDKPLTCTVAMLFVSILLVSGCNDEQEKSKDQYSGKLFEFNNASEPRWSSPENLNGSKGAGGKENNGGKGHPNDSIPAGQSKSLLDIQGRGIINRIWITINDRSPEMLRSLKLEMFWDGAEKPAVSVPFGDFFGVGLGRTAAFENVFFANAEGRSFNSFIPMPFQKGQRLLSQMNQPKS